MGAWGISGSFIPYLLGLSLVLLLVLLALLIPFGRYARRVGLAPRYWIMVNMVCWAVCWLIFKWAIMPFIRLMHWPVLPGIYATLILCLLSYLIVWFIVWKKGDKNLSTRIDEIGKKD